MYDPVFDCTHYHGAGRRHFRALLKTGTTLRRLLLRVFRRDQMEIRPSREEWMNGTDDWLKFKTIAVYAILYTLIFEPNRSTNGTILWQQ